MTRLLVLFIAVLFCAGSAWADPRMETNDNFCHFIKDKANTDNEVFVADCGSVINVDDDTGTASGYARVSMRLPRGFVTSALFVSEPGDTPCSMVESNGTTYVSDNWISKINLHGATVTWGAASNNQQQGPPKIKTKTVVFELYCMDGVAE